MKNEVLLGIRKDVFYYTIAGHSEKVIILVFHRFQDLFLQKLSLIDEGVLWTGKVAIENTLHNISGTIVAEEKIAFEEISRILEKSENVREQTELTIFFLEKYLQEEKQDLTLAAMCLASFKIFGGFENRDDLAFSVLSAAVLGEIENPLPYHNNCHYKKVLLHTIRLIAAHNKIFSDTGNVLNPVRISQLLAAACAHDVGHEAKSNFKDRKYIFAAQEDRSYNYLRPFLSAFGYSDAMCEEVRIMFLTTDVSPFGDVLSPSNQLRAGYEMHFGSSEYDDNLQLRDELKILEENSKLTLMCMILHEADIMNSAGVDYDITVQESCRIAQEIGKTCSSPEDTYLFLKMICCEKMMSDAGQFLASENMHNILKRVYDDIKSGVKCYEQKCC